MQVVSFDAAAGDTNEEPLIISPCMRALVKIAGISFQKTKRLTRIDKRVSLKFYLVIISIS